jgi:tubulin polyglutamylase TTLL6/13
MHGLARKNCLARNLGRMARVFPNDYNFFPRTWNLPMDMPAFKRHIRGRFFIVKPEASS